MSTVEQLVPSVPSSACPDWCESHEASDENDPSAGGYHSRPDVRIGEEAERGVASSTRNVITHRGLRRCLFPPPPIESMMTM